MQKVRRLRAWFAVAVNKPVNPAQSWKLLAEAEYWEHLAHARRLPLRDAHHSSSDLGEARRNS